MILNSMLYNRKASGSITVFLSLILLLVLSLLLTITEGARVGIAKVNSQRAFSTAMDSVLAEYYGPLWEEYHIFGLYCDGEAAKKDMIADKLKGYMSYTLEPEKDLHISEDGSFDPYNINLKSVAVEEETRLSDYQGELLINEAVEYMKYREMGNGAEQLLNKLSLMKAPEKVSYIYEEKEKAEEELVKIDKGILRLMELLDGLKTSKKGIELSKSGTLKTSEYFVKKICFGEITKESVGINHESVFQVLKSSYTNPKKVFEEIEGNFNILNQSRREIDKINSDKNSVSEELTAEQSRLGELNATKDKTKKIKQQIKEVKKKVDSLETKLKGFKDDISEQYTLIIAKTDAIHASARDLLQLIGGIKPVISEAISTLETVIFETETVAPFINKYEQILNSNRDSIDDNTYSGMEESLNQMKRYVSTDASGYDFKGMKKILKNDLEVLTQVEDLITSGDMKLTKEQYDDSNSTFREASEKILNYQTKGLTLDYSTLVIDRSSQNNPIDAVTNLLQSGITSMVVDPNKLSEGVLTQNALPSEITSMSQENTDFLSKLIEFFKNAAAGTSSAGSLLGSGGDVTKILSIAGDGVNKLAGHLLYQEYLKDHFDMFYFEKNDTARKPSVLSYEQEYLLVGKPSDQENLSSIISRLALLRTISDFVSLLGDSAKRNEAKVAATALVGFTGLPILVAITQVIILIAWSFAEALLDVCALMSGKEVPVFKKKTILELPQIFLINRSFLQSKVKTLKSTNELSMSYQDYLRMFLLLKNKKDLANRSMDLMQENIKIRYNANSFDIMNCLFGFESSVSYTIPTKFTGIPFVQKYLGIDKDGFNFASKSACSY